MDDDALFAPAAVFLFYVCIVQDCQYNSLDSTTMRTYDKFCSEFKAGEIVNREDYGNFECVSKWFG